MLHLLPKEKHFLSILPVRCHVAGGIVFTGNPKVGIVHWETAVYIGPVGRVSRERVSRGPAARTARVNR